MELSDLLEHELTRLIPNEDTDIINDIEVSNEIDDDNDNDETEEIEKSLGNLRENSVITSFVSNIWDSNVQNKTRRKYKKKIQYSKRLGEEITNILGQINLFYVNGQINECIPLLSDIIKAKPYLSEPYELLAQIYDETGNKLLALQFYILEAINTKKRTDLWRDIVIRAYELKQYDQALSAIKRVLRVDSSDISIHKIKLSIFLNINQINKAWYYLKFLINKFSDQIDIILEYSLLCFDKNWLHESLRGYLLYVSYYNGFNYSDDVIIFFDLPILIYSENFDPEIDISSYFFALERLIDLCYDIKEYEDNSELMIYNLTIQSCSENSLNYLLNLKEKVGSNRNDLLFPKGLSLLFAISSINKGDDINIDKGLNILKNIISFPSISVVIEDTVPLTDSEDEAVIKQLIRLYLQLHCLGMKTLSSKLGVYIFTNLNQKYDLTAYQTYFRQYLSTYLSYHTSSNSYDRSNSYFRLVCQFADLFKLSSRINPLSLYLCCLDKCDCLDLKLLGYLLAYLRIDPLNNFYDEVLNIFDKFINKRLTRYHTKLPVTRKKAIKPVDSTINLNIDNNQHENVESDNLSNKEINNNENFEENAVGNEDDNKSHQSNIDDDDDNDDTRSESSRKSLNLELIDDDIITDDVNEPKLMELLDAIANNDYNNLSDNKNENTSSASSIPNDDKLHDSIEPIFYNYINIKDEMSSYYEFLLYLANYITIEESEENILLMNSYTRICLPWISNYIFQLDIRKLNKRKLTPTINTIPEYIYINISDDVSSNYTTICPSLNQWLTLEEINLKTYQYISNLSVYVIIEELFDITIIMEKLYFCLEKLELFNLRSSIQSIITCNQSGVSNGNKNTTIIYKLNEFDETIITVCRAISNTLGELAEALSSKPTDIPTANKFIRFLITRDINLCPYINLPNNIRDCLPNYMTSYFSINQSIEQIIPLHKFYLNHSKESVFINLYTGHENKLIRKFSEALGNYFDAWCLDQSQPITSLSIVSMLIFLAYHRSTSQRHAVLMKGISFLGLYKILRSENIDSLNEYYKSNPLDDSSGDEMIHKDGLEQEIYYNMGYAFSLIGMHHFAVECYQHGLEIYRNSTYLNNNSNGRYLQLTREIAHNLVLIFKRSRNDIAAYDVMKEYLVY